MNNSKVINNRNNTIHLRISEKDKVKYSKLADMIGVSLSSFARLSMAKAAKSVESNEYEIL